MTAGDFKVFFFSDITIRANESSRTVREDAGVVEICFIITKGSIAKDTDITLQGNLQAVDVTAKGIFVLTFTLMFLSLL